MHGRTQCGGREGKLSIMHIIGNVAVSTRAFREAICSEKGHAGEKKTELPRTYGCDVSVRRTRRGGRGVRMSGDSREALLPDRDWVGSSACSTRRPARAYHGPSHVLPLYNPLPATALSLLVSPLTTPCEPLPCLAHSPQASPRPRATRVPRSPISVRPSPCAALSSLQDRRRSCAYFRSPVSNRPPAGFPAQSHRLILTVAAIRISPTYRQDGNELPPLPFWGPHLRLLDLQDASRHYPFDDFPSTSLYSPVSVSPRSPSFLSRDAHVHATIHRPSMVSMEGRTYSTECECFHSSPQLLYELITS